jgi:hypothetical protein
MENISDLTAELRLLQIADMQCTHAAPCSGTNASELQGAEGAGVDADAAINQENNGGGAETWVPGAQAYDIHRCSNKVNGRLPHSHYHESHCNCWSSTCTIKISHGST